LEEPKCIVFSEEQLLFGAIEPVLRSCSQISIIDSGKVICRKHQEDLKFKRGWFFVKDVFRCEKCKKEGNEEFHRYYYL